MKEKQQKRNKNSLDWQTCPELLSEGDGQLKRKKGREEVQISYVNLGGTL